MSINRRLKFSKNVLKQGNHEVILECNNFKIWKMKPSPNPLLTPITIKHGKKL